MDATSPSSSGAATRAEPSSGTDNSRVPIELASRSGLKAMDTEVAMGIRAAKLNKALEQTTEKYCASARHILELFPNVKGHRARLLKEWAAAMSVQLKRCIDAECKELWKELNLVELLNRLDQITEDESLSTDDGSCNWRPSGDANEDIDAGDARGPEVRVWLEKELESAKEMTEQLEAQCAAKEAALARTRERLNESWGRIDKLGSVLSDLPLEEASRVLDNPRHDKSAQCMPPSKRKRLA
ncbi:uncharacterized protein LOC135825834 [Sycon ciliatum]|uniref:uncharacterized protein LOC135825834 n=1 Tax=Sycon ciliatum TaxID=27933 RepID=UPI0020A9FF60|eukprot:scpid96379/ scgid18852/ 